MGIEVDFIFFFFCPSLLWFWQHLTNDQTTMIPSYGFFGRGLRLRIAITVACQLVIFLSLGKKKNRNNKTNHSRLLSSLATTKASSRASWATPTGSTPSTTPTRPSKASSCPSTTWVPSRGASSPLPCVKRRGDGWPCGLPWRLLW